jgi:hypothetical protein
MTRKDTAQAVGDQILAHMTVTRIPTRRRHTVARAASIPAPIKGAVTKPKIALRITA